VSVKILFASGGMDGWMGGTNSGSVVSEMV